MKSIFKSLSNRSQLYRPVFCSVGVRSQSSNRNDSKDDGPKNSQRILISTALAGFVGYHLYEKQKNPIYAKTETAGIPKKSKENENRPGTFNGRLPSYSLEEIGRHTTMETRIWVTYKQGVYDITKFVEGHPGGDQILIAAGSSVEPFWLLYGIHENPHVFEILETLRIGNLKEEYVDRPTGDVFDPYGKEPKRHAALRPASQKPFNAECPPSLLVESFITPNELFYVRNHLPVPDVDPNTYELEIEVEGEDKNVTFTLDELKKLPKHTITATIMCAGNRRSDMTKIKAVKGLNWGPAAVGNAKWTGVRLRDVLKMAGINVDDDKYKHVQFEGFDLDATGKTYGASIPIWKALDKRGDVILAFEMNGVPIPRDHGFPVRVIVPGIVGARNVKWLAKVIVSEKESDSHWQQNDYKGFSPSTDWDTVDFTKAPAIQELPVISAICQPSEGNTIKVVDGHILVKGYAWSGGGQKIVRVDITADKGKTWHVANLDSQDKASPPQHWSWTLWSVKIPVDKSWENVEIWAKAVDSCYNVQPETFENIWNLRGVLSNAYHRVKAKLEH